MNQAGAPMQRLHAFGHTTSCTACSKAALPPAAARGSPSRISAFRDTPISYSCSVDTAHAAVTTRSAAERSGDAEPPGLAAPWQPLSPSISLADSAAATSRTQHHTNDGPSHLSDSSRQLIPLAPIQPAPQQQTALQHSISQHSQPAAAASAASQPSPTEAWHAQHTEAVSCWRLLVDPGQDETSAIILSCSSIQQLLGVAQELLRKPVSKWHYARLAAMAAVLTAPTGTQLRQPTAAGPQEASAHHQAPPMPAQQQLPGQQLVQQQEKQVQQPELQSAGAASQHYQQQQQQEAHAAYALTCRVLEAVASPCIDTGLPTLHALRGVYLAETLHAVQQLQQRFPQGPSGLQPQQQQLQQHMASMQEPALLSAIHGCGSAEQLRSVVSLASAYFSPLHLKAVFVQFARLVSPTGSSAGTATTFSRSRSSSSSGRAALLQRLLQLLALQLPALQPHQCASILWSLGQLQHLTSIHNPSTRHSTDRHSNSSSGIDLLSMQQQLLQGALAGLQRLNPRVCAQLLHGAAKLQLQVPEADLQMLVQHTQQQLQQCDPQALSCMLWSFAKLQRPADQGPDEGWLEAFYSSSWRRLQPEDSSSNVSSSFSDSSIFSDSSNTQQDRAPAWRRKDVCSGFEPPELSALLTAACSWQLQPPSGWLAAVADSASRQMPSFQHQELGLLLWSFARLQYIPPRALVEAAGMRSLELGPGSFSSQTLSLLLYGATRLQRWQWQAQQPTCDQQGQQLDFPASDAVAAEPLRWVQWNAVDLAILAWSLGMQQMLLDKQRKQQQQQQRASSSTTQQQEQQQEQCHGLLPPAVLQAATAKLQQHQFSRQGISMLIWGLGTALQRGSLGNSSSVVAQAQQHAGLLAALLEAAAAAVEPHAADLSPHELSSVVSGLGALSKAWQAAMQASTATACPRTTSSGSSTSSSSGGGARSAAAAECLDLLSCQLLYACDKLSNYQLAAAVQGLCWAQHPRGLDVLHAALLPEGTVSRLHLAQPQELLLYLRACVAYKYVPLGAAWGGVVAALQRVCPQLESGDAAQLLYLLGKLQMLSDRRQRQRAVQAAAAAATAAMWAASEHQRKRQERAQLHRQREKHVVMKPLLPEPLLGKLMTQTQGCVQQCSSRDVSLMLWGVSHLQRHQPCPPRQQDQGTAGSSEAADSRAASGIDKQADQLVASIYPYALQQLHLFAPGNLATLLYALHRLRARPEDSWLQTVATRFTAQQLSSMDGQSLAVLALALAGLSWVAPKAWLHAYVQAVAAVDRRGGLVTTWQKRCINNSLAALNPLAVKSWLQ